MSKKGKLTRLEDIVFAQPEAVIRIALIGAVRFALDNKKAFEESYGTYGGEGLEALVKKQT